MVILYHFITILYHKMMNFFKWRDVSGICCLSRMFVFMLIFLFVYTFHVGLFVCLYFSCWSFCLSILFVLIFLFVYTFHVDLSVCLYFSCWSFCLSILSFSRLPLLFGQFSCRGVTRGGFGCRSTQCATFAPFAASLHKYNLVFAEIQFGIWTNKSWYLNKYNLIFGQIQFDIWGVQRECAFNALCNFCLIWCQSGQI